MVIDKQKVIVLPKEFSKKPNEFLCPCETCAERAFEEQMRQDNIEEVKIAVEEMLSTTSLNTRMFNIDIVSSQAPHRQLLNTFVGDSKTDIIDLKPFLALFNYTYKQTTKFNQSFRHPMICKLRDVCEELGSQITVYERLFQSEEQDEVLLWQYQKILLLATEILTQVNIINSEAFLSSDIIDSIIKKVRAAKLEATKMMKKRFIQALESESFQPRSSRNDFRIEYSF